SREEKDVGNCRRLGHRQDKKSGNPEQRMRPEAAKRQDERDLVVVPCLPDPPDFATEKQAGEKDCVAEPQNGAKQNGINGLDAAIDRKSCRPAKVAPLLATQKYVDRTRYFW